MEFKKIAFDVMGSDSGSSSAIEAALQITKEKKDLKIILVGDKDEINNFLSSKKYNKDQIEVFPTTQVITMSDGIMDIRRKKDSSMVKAMELTNDKKTDAILTGGNSACFIAGSHFIFKEFENVSRPAFMPVIPTLKSGKVVLMLDVGANSENTTEDLVNFALMATAYSKVINKIEQPNVGLLNIGAESSKGNDLQRETYSELTKNKKVNFYGNIEPRYITSGDVDIIVTDGFTGNIALKSIEGMAKNLMSEIKASITKTLFRKLAALRLKKAFKEVAAKFDYKNHAGAILLGVNRIAFKSHGSSDVRSFHSTLRMTYDAISNDVITKMKKVLVK